MHCGKRPGHGIADQNRNAVGRLYRQQHVRGVTDQSVAVLVITEHAGFGHRVGFGMNDTNVGAMNLPAAGQRPAACEEFEKSPAILVNVFRLVFIKSGEVQRILQHGADAADPG